MTVYVDNARIPYRRMKMSHMLADSLDELHAMADRIGVARRWFQGEASTPHYDVCQSKADAAILNGAELLSRRDMVRLIRKWRESKCQS